MIFSKIRSTQDSRWAAFSLAYLVMVLFGFSLQSLPPLFPAIHRDIPLSHAEEGLLMAAFGLPGLLVPFAAARFAARWGEKRVIAGGLGLLAVGLLVSAAAPGFWTMYCGRLLAGGGGILLLTAAPVLVNSLFGRENIGKAIGFFNTGVPVGLVLAVTLTPLLSRHSGWRVCIVLTAVVSALLLAAAGFSAGRPAPRPGAAARRTRKSLPATVLLLALVNVLVGASTAPFATFAGDYLNLQAGAAGSLVLAAMMAETALLGPLVGVLVDRWSMHRRFLFCAGGLLSGGFALVLHPQVPLIVGPLLLGAGSAIVPVTMFPLLGEVVGEERMSEGLALLIVSSNIGTNLGLSLFGAALDRLGGFAAAVPLLSVTAALAAAVAVTIRRPGRGELCTVSPQGATSA